ncbi:MAG: crossover junction endodeoxyribonuclease RuvC [Candidatus Omnitrophica bacterium]|nr:crossover junction endodeoxyribonuclease RuvC [Candidatus Omnitrophota bacterium]MDD5436823.1 crossover junction endodeoxyribonuclease RuvC [Candidatus Omnitrophota bacterium]
MRILGIDPGLQITGYGIIEDKNFKLVEAGIIRTISKTPIQTRIARIFDEISGIVDEHRPGVLVLEKIYSHYKHPTTAILMGHARAMACLVCGKFNIKLINYPSTRIKKAITGNGHASKQQVQRMVQGLLKLRHPPEPVDVSDALAMAISYCYIEKGISFPSSEHREIPHM